MLEHETCYQAVRSRDARFDGWFVTAVRTTGVYCRPSCPATTPRRPNVTFLPTAAAAQLAGYRACRRCRPDASPDSPQWNVRSDTVARAMRLVRDGVVDRAGVAGLAARLGYSERQLHRLLVAEVGAGAQALARAQRAHTARTLVETTDLRLAEVAFAAGFASVRQFNETLRAVFASTPRQLREAARTRGPAPAPGSMVLRLAARRPFDGRWLLRLLASKAVPGVEAYDGATFRRALLLPHGEATVDLDPAADHVLATLRLTDPRDVVPAVARLRRLLDLDADSVAVEELLGADPLLGPLVATRPGVRVPGAVDGFEMAVRAVLGQQVSVAGARTVAGRLVAAYGKPLTRPDGQLTHHFPTAEALAAADPASWPLPGARARSVVALSRAVAAGDLDLDPAADRATARAGLLALPGVGPWTAEYLRLRVLGDPDAFPAHDLGVRRGLERLGAAGDPRRAVAIAEAWRPWRAYAVLHLWDLASRPATDREDQQ